MHPSKKKILDIYGHEPTDMDDLARCIIAVINDASCSYAARRNIVKIVPPRVVGFSWTVDFGQVSNYHNAPLEGGTNFGGYKKDVPRNYPGWEGRVWIRYSATPPHFGNLDFFGASLTYPGTGGFGGYDGPWENLYTRLYRYQCDSGNRMKAAEPIIYSWDYRFFASDWPLVTKSVEGLMLFSMLQNDYVSEKSKHHKFLWEDPVIKLADEKFN